MAAVCALGSCSRMMPLRATCSRSVSSLNCCAGVIGSQSLAQRSAPNTAMPRSLQAFQRRRRHVKKGNRKNGVLGVVVAFPCSAISTAAMPLSISPVAAVRLHVFQIVMGPGVVPDGMTLRGYASHQFGVFGGGLSDQEEGGAHAFVRQRRQHSRRPCAGHGPSSKVSTTSWSSRRQGLRKALEAHARRGSGVDRENA